MRLSGVRRQEAGDRGLVVRRMEDGGWRMEDVGWRMWGGEVVLVLKTLPLRSRGNCVIDPGIVASRAC